MKARDGAPSAEVRLLEMMRGYRQPYAIYLSVRLGIPDLLDAQGKTAVELARITQTHPRALERLLRALSSSGVFEEVSPGTFRHSPMSELLRRDHPRSRVPSVLFLGAPYTLESWSALEHSVKTGGAAFEQVHGMGKWRYNQHHPEDGAIFDAVMAGARPARIEALLQGYDFSTTSVVIDVGGGHGQLLAAVLARHDRLRGVLYDLPEVVREARPLLKQAGVAERCEVVGGDFLTAIPGGDTYLLSDILHDWPDEQCLAILRACRAAIAPGGRLIVIEYVLVPGATPPHVAWLDLQMMVEFGEGRQRSVDELRSLFAATGFAVDSVIPTSDVDLVVAVPI